LCAAGQECTDGTATLSLDTTKFPDRTLPAAAYHLVVTVSDTAGGVGTAYDEPDFQIWNHRPTGSSTATLIIGSAVPTPQPQPFNPGGGVLGASKSSCAKPKLSMRLSQKPLRIRHRMPVLAKGKKYRFKGRLTCLVHGKRHSAPKHTRVELRAIMHGKSHRKGQATVRSHGRLVLRFSVPSSRTLEFRFKTPGEKMTRVRIKVRVVKVAKHKKHHHKKG
jgi:hypothetical protein